MCSFIVKAFPRSGCFGACVGAHFPLVELDHSYQFTLVPGPVGIVLKEPAGLTMSLKGLRGSHAALIPTSTMFTMLELFCSIDLFGQHVMTTTNYWISRK